MAQLTPLAKTLIGVIVLGVASAVTWNIVKSDDGETASATTDGATTANPYAGASANNSSGDGNAPDIKIGLNSFHGFAPGLMANGGSLTTQAGSIFDKKGLNVEFVIQDDIPTLDTIFTSGAAQCTWRTSDFWAQEQPNLRNAGLDARAVMAVDNTQGADAIVSNSSNVRRIEDLAGKKVALLQFTPSHGMLIDAIENSSLSARAKQSVQMVFINADEGMAGIAAALNSGNVDAAVMWDPDLSMVVNEGAHVIYSTKVASNLIFDMIVCDTRFLNTPNGRDAVQKLVEGWMEAVPLARADKPGAATALVNSMDYYSMLTKQEGKPFIQSLFNNVVWTGLEDNARIFGMVGGTNHYERVYRRFDGIYRGIGALANPKSPVIAPQDSIDYSFIRNLLEANKDSEARAKAQQAAQERSFTVAKQEEAVNAAPAAVTKPVSVFFDTGSARLNERAKQIINNEMAPFIDNNGTAYFEVSGNTDSTGSLATNMSLSKQRAAAVVDYLVSEWAFPAARFRVVGNGPNKPICNEANPAEEGLSLAECRASNRSTRVAVFAAQ